MASSKTLLSRDEVLVRHMHTHPKVLLWPGLLEVVILAGAVVLTVWMPVSWGSVPYIILWAVTLIASVPVLFLPWLRWMTTTYTVTSMRVVTRSGILRRTGHDLPMSRISDVQLDRDVVDRLFGCGTLTLQTSANDPLPLYGPGGDRRPPIPRRPGRRGRRPAGLRHNTTLIRLRPPRFRFTV